MVYEYVVILKNERRKYVDFISIVLCVLSSIFFMQQFYLSYISAAAKYVFLIAPPIIIFIVIWNIRSTRKNSQYPVSYSRALVVTGLTWLMMPFLMWIGLPILLLSFFERPVNHNLEIGFDNDQVVFNTLIKRKFAWKDFNNIILKDNILTLDFQNNKVIQHETIDDQGDADEQEFNDYCRRKLLAADRNFR